MDTLTAAEKTAVIKKYLADPRTTGGRDRVFQHLRKDYGNQITRREVAQVLADDPVSQVHQPQKKRVISRPVIVSDRAKMWQIDLIDMPNLLGHNDQRRYALTAVDVLSKYCAARPITKKTASNVDSALADILDSIPKSWRPKVISMDRGAEFRGKVERSLEEREIKVVHSQPYAPQSHGQVERLNRTIKSALFSLMARHETKRWIDFLEPLMENLNNTKHESTGYSPLQLMRRPALGKEMIEEIHERMARRRFKPEESYEEHFEVGDFVRVALTTEAAIRRQTFRKRVQNNWSTEVYQIYSVSEPEAAGARPSYLLKNLFTNRKSRKPYWGYQLQEISAAAAQQAVHANIPVDEPEVAVAEAASAPNAAVPHLRRSNRAWAPSQQALQNLA